jgi:hypothetical protein
MRPTYGWSFPSSCPFVIADAGAAMTAVRARATVKPDRNPRFPVENLSTPFLPKDVQETDGLCKARRDRRRMRQHGLFDYSGVSPE